MTRSVLKKPVAGARRFELVVGQDLERQMEAPIELVLPLLSQAARADHEAALQVAAGNQLLHQEPGHDRLARARVVGQQEAKRLARKHRLIDCCDLVRQRLNQRGMHGEHRVEQMRQTDAMRLGNEAEKGPVAVEAPGAALLDYLQAWFVMPVEKYVCHLARRGSCK